MTFNALLTAALRFQRRHILGRTVAVAVGLVMVVATLELQGALTRGVAQAPADLGPATSVIVRSPASFGIFGEAQRPGLPVETIESVAGVAGVEHAEGDDQGTVGVVVDGDRSEAVLGTWFEDEGLRPAKVAFGDAPADVAVAVSTDLAEREGLKVGDPIQLVGRVRIDATVGGIVETLDDGSGAPDIYAPLVTANAIVGSDGQVDRIVLSGGPTEDALASAVFVSHPEQDTVTRTNFDKERTDAERDRAYGTRRLFTLFAGVAVAVTALIVVSGTAAAVVRRTSELATLRTAGATPRQVQTLVLAEAAVVGLVGGLAAGPLGTLMAMVLHGRSGGFGLTLPEAGPRLDLLTLAISVALGVILGVVGAWFPARRAGRLSVSAALGGLVEPNRRLIGRAAVAGVVLIAIALVVSGSGSRADADLGRAGLSGLLLVTGSCIVAAAAVGVTTRLLERLLPSKRWPVTRLAVGNLARSPARTAGTAISVLVGIGLVMLTTVFASSFDANVSTSVRKLYKADATLAGASEMPGVPRANLEAVDGAFGVRTATPVRTGPVKIGSTVGTAIAIDHPRSFLGPAFPAAAVRALDGKSILVRSGLGLSPGARVTVVGAEGEVETTVAGTYPGRIVDRTGAVIDAVLPLSAGDRIFRSGPDQAILARTFGRFGPADLEQAVGADPALQVTTLDGYADRVGSSGGRTLALTLGLLAMTLITSMIGLTNTVMASVAERTPELSLLRALGLGAGQLARLVVMEAAVLASMVAVAAAVVATATGSLLVSSVAPEGTPISIPWGRIAVIAVVATGLCALAGLVPAIRATRISVHEGLVDE
jgi:putative ABC transport system permease protein